jgi:hypothetical protein
MDGIVAEEAAGTYSETTSQTGGSALYLRIASCLWAHDSLSNRYGEFLAENMEGFGNPVHFGGMR